MTYKGNEDRKRPTDSEEAVIHLTELLTKAKRYAESDPEVALALARKAAETICLWLFAHEIGKPGVMMLDELIKKLQTAGVIPRSVVIPLQTVQGYGNYGVHAQLDHEPISPDWVAPSLSALHQVTSWYFVQYLGVPMPEELDGRGGAKPAANAPVAGPRPDRVGAPEGVAPVEAVKDPIDPAPASSAPVGSSPGPTPSRASALLGGRYLDLSDGTVLDTQTNLQWMRCALGQRWDGGKCLGEADELEWDEMFAQVDAFNKQGGFAGHGDWRAPTIDELRTLIIDGREPCWDEVTFPNVPKPQLFWSSSPYAGYSDDAWRVDFDDGIVGYGYKYYPLYVRLVRAGQ